jgi:hypothetical protein
MPDTSGAQSMWMKLIGGVLSDAMNKPNSAPAGPYTPANTGGAMPDYSNPITSSLYKPAAWTPQAMDSPAKPFDYSTWAQPGALSNTKAGGGGYTAQTPPAPQGSSY